MICGKTIYSTQENAVRAMWGMNGQMVNVKAGHDNHGIERVHRHKRAKAQLGKTYFCTGCNGWHVATAGKKHHKKNGLTKEIHVSDKQVIGKSQAPLIIHDPHKFKVK